MGTRPRIYFFFKNRGRVPECVSGKLNEHRILTYHKKIFRVDSFLHCLPEPVILGEEEEEEEEVPLFQCDDCGNLWDGAAQCLCGGWGLEEEEAESSGYESM